jgi:hypothetical protein
MGWIRHFFFIGVWGTPGIDVFGLVFVIAGLYFIFGRFLFKILKKKHTYYAVTNKRVLVLTTLVTRSLRAAFIDRIPAINKTARFGRGTITFGNRRSWTFKYENTGMEFLSWGYGDDVPTFHDIKDVDTVYALVNELREKKESEIF